MIIHRIYTKRETRRIAADWKQTADVVREQWSLFGIIPIYVRTLRLEVLRTF